MNNLGALLPFVLIALVFWLLIVRPQRKRQQELSSTQASLEPGAEVMLGSGIFGTVVSLENETVHLEIAPGTTVKVARQAVIRVIPVEPAEPPSGAGPESTDDLPDQQDQ